MYHTVKSIAQLFKGLDLWYEHSINILRESGCMKVRIRLQKQFLPIVIYLTFTLLIVRAVAGICGMPQYSSVRYLHYIYAYVTDQFLPKCKWDVIANVKGYRIYTLHCMYAITYYRCRIKKVGMYILKRVYWPSNSGRISFGVVHVRNRSLYIPTAILSVIIYNDRKKLVCI